MPEKTIPTLADQSSMKINVVAGKEQENYQEAILHSLSPSARKLEGWVEKKGKSFTVR